mgnify:CR=1 FL=1
MKAPQDCGAFFVFPIINIARFFFFPLKGLEIFCPKLELESARPTVYHCMERPTGLGLGFI